MVTEKDVEKLLGKVEKVTKEKKLDLSSDEDLSIGIMNLISIEEHLFFTAEKTGNQTYYDLLREVREMRKELLKKIIKEYEGEVWCISKHLLASSMRLMEVGTKQLGRGNKTEAKGLFEKSYTLYSLFWALNLKIIKPESVKGKVVSEEELKKAVDEETGFPQMAQNVPEQPRKAGVFAGISNLVKNALDCCIE